MRDHMGNFLNRLQFDETEADRIREMFYPVRCTHCSQVHDAGKVEVTARYADCSVWKSPCCGRTVDDRGEGWKSRPDITVINKATLR